VGKAFSLKAGSKCGECNQPIHEGDLYTIIYEDDDSGKIKQLQCDNCEVDDNIAHYRKTGEISSHLSLEASMANYHYTEGHDMSRLREDVQHFYAKYKKDLLEIAEGSEKIHTVIREFENKHWLPYLKKYWNNTDQRGHEAKVGKIKLMLWGCAGRVLITAERGTDDITMIFTDEKSQVTANGGQQGIHGSQQAAMEVLQELVNADKIKFKHNNNVKMAGL
jgi:hypothetical protein